MKFVLIYLVLLTILLLFNYGAHSKEKRISELSERKDRKENDSHRTDSRDLNEPCCSCKMIINNLPNTSCERCLKLGIHS